MKLTKQQKIYGAVLVLGLGVLGFDQLRPGPQSADAMEASSFTVPASARTPAPGVAAVQEMSPAAAEKLRAIQDTVGPSIGDAFWPSASWRGETTVAVETSDTPTVSSREKFAGTHKLNAVMVAGNSGQVIVDGRSLIVGQSLEGFRLATVTQRSAVFEGAEGRVVLKLDEPR